MRADTIVGYTFNADQYGPECIVAQVTTNPGDVHHRDAKIDDAETHLDLLARIAGIDRMDEHSFDSGDFPKVIFAVQVESDEERCGACGEPLIA